MIYSNSFYQEAVIMQDPSTYDGYTLPVNHLLHNRYRIDKLLGQGGFAIIYECTDITVGRSVAVKEYFPAGLAKREQKQDFFVVQPFDQNKMEFEKGHHHFLKEAEILKECHDLPGIVTVYDFFEENRTAYIVMEYIEGLTLEQYVHTNGVLAYSEILELLLPLIHSLEKIHEKGLIHRDISPDNLILGLDNRLHLIDFGAATMKQIDYNRRQTTIILKKGYAPPEQYLSSGNMGTWSDIYALCATIYFAVSGQTPVSSIDRLQRDTLRPLSDFSDISPRAAAIIERGLSLHTADRYKTIRDFSYALEHPESVENCKTVMELSPAAADVQRLPEQPAANSPEHSFTTLFRHPQKGILILLILCLAAGGTLYLTGTRSPLRQRVVSVNPATSSDTNSAGSTYRPQSIDTGSANDEASDKTSLPAASSSELPVTSGAPVVLTMKKLTGLSQKTARSKIHKLDPSIQIRVEKKYHSTVKKGRVISQSVKTGTIFNTGSINRITLTVSRGAKPVVRRTTSSGSGSGHTATKQLVTTAKPAATSKASKNNSDFQIQNKPKKNTFEID